MSYSEQRAALVAAVESREGKNQYTQGSKRDQVDSGWSDCSSLMRWAHQKALGVYIGDNTEGQILSSKLATINVSISAGVPNESQMLPGDLLFFRGKDTSRKSSQYVGHVEMYVGNGECSGHGSGIGPTRKNMADYCRERQARTSPVPAGNQGLICIRRAVTGIDKSKGEWEGVNVEQFIRDLYVQILGREADQGLQDWLDYINQGHSFQEVYEGFIHSPEGRRHYVQELYHHLLGREGSADEVADWVDRLANGMSQEDVYKGFTGSEEYKRKDG